MSSNVIQRLGDLPVAQEGYFTRAQATEAGVEDFELTRATKHGFIARVGHGVYRVAGAGYDPLADLRVAWFRLDATRSPRDRLLRPDIWVSHESAAAVHGLGVFLADEHSFVTCRRIQVGPGIHVRRRANGLARADWTTRNGFAVTSVARTATDLLAARADGGHVGRFLLDAFRTGAAQPDDVRAAMAITTKALDTLLAQAESKVGV